MEGLHIQVVGAHQATPKDDVSMMEEAQAMTIHGFADLPEDPRIIRTLVKEAEGNLGVYATIEKSGSVRAGDTVILLSQR